VVPVIKPPAKVVELTLLVLIVPPLHVRELFVPLNTRFAVLTTKAPDRVIVMVAFG
jgi:hypothetical protein